MSDIVIVLELTELEAEVVATLCAAVDDASNPSNYNAAKEVLYTLQMQGFYGRKITDPSHITLL